MPKKEAIKGIQALADDASWDDIMYCLYVNQKIEKGLKNMDDGSVFSSEEARRRLREFSNE